MNTRRLCLDNECCEKVEVNFVGEDIENIGKLFY